MLEEAVVARPEGTCKSMRHRLRSCLDRVAASAGVLAWYERRMRRGLTILMYHRVLPAEQCVGYPLQSLVMPVSAFCGQMRWLARHCRVMPVREAVQALVQGRHSERPLVAVTFDDGYADNCEIAAGILEEHGLRATFFVTSGFVEQGEPMWFDRAADAWMRLSERYRLELLRSFSGTSAIGNRCGRGDEIKPWMDQLKHMQLDHRLRWLRGAEQRAGRTIRRHLYRPMTPAQVVQLHQSGHEIASHTVTHPILPQLSLQECHRELTESREQIERWIGAEVVGFCYPNGDLDASVEAAVGRAGYLYACTTAAGLNRQGVSPTRLSRLAITMQRTVCGRGNHDELGFRSELSQLRNAWR